MVNSLSISGRIGIHAESAIEAATIATLGIKQKLKCIKQQPTGDLTATLDEIEVRKTKVHEVVLSTLFFNARETRHS